MIQIERIVKKVINSFIKENCYPVNEYYGRFNTKKEDSKLMPSNKYQVMVYSNDHNPPHFHVIDNNGWVVKFLIENDSATGSIIPIDGGMRLIKCV